MNRKEHSSGHNENIKEGRYQSPGEDQIVIQIVKEAQNILIPTLAKPYNTCFQISPAIAHFQPEFSKSRLKNCLSKSRTDAEFATYLLKRRKWTLQQGKFSSQCQQQVFFGYNLKSSVFTTR